MVVELGTPGRPVASAARRRRLRAAAVSRRLWGKSRWLSLYEAELLTLHAEPFCSTPVLSPLAASLRTESSKATAVAVQQDETAPLRTESSKATAAAKQQGEAAPLTH